MEDIDSLLKERSFFVDDGLHYRMKAEEFLFNTAPFGDSGSNHQRHGASNTNKTSEQETRIVAGSERTETGEGAPDSESTENEIGAGGLKRTETECGPDGKRQTKESEAVPLRPEK